MLLTEYLKRRRFFTQVEETLGQLDKRYLLSEMMPESCRLEDKLYRSYLRLSNKSVIDEVNRLNQEQLQYKEFVESWIHEVKLPITAMELICENAKAARPEGGDGSGKLREIKAQLSVLEDDVEKILFYARSDTVYQDYFIREVNLRDAVSLAILRNAPFMKQNNAGITVTLTEEYVFGDEKWLVFIISQLLINCVKYKKDGGCHIIIKTNRGPNHTDLVIEDDGTGIKAEELGRIFDKGFTGSNGRNNRKSTGIGLYLCRKLCGKLGISIKAESQEGQYTRVILGFPDGREHFSR